MKKYDVYISCSQKDYLLENGLPDENSIVARILKTFDNEGITYWVDKKEFCCGKGFPDEKSKAIEDSRLFLFISTVNSNFSEQTVCEIETAQSIDLPIIAFRVGYPTYNPQLTFVLSRCNISNIEGGSFSQLLSIIDEYLSKMKAEEREWKRKKDAEYQDQLDKIQSQVFELEEKLDGLGQSMTREEQGSFDERVCYDLEEALKNTRIQIRQQLEMLMMLIEDMEREEMKISRVKALRIHILDLLHMQEALVRRNKRRAEPFKKKIEEEEQVGFNCMLAEKTTACPCEDKNSQERDNKESTKESERNVSVEGAFIGGALGMSIPNPSIVDVIRRIFGIQSGKTAYTSIFAPAEVKRKSHLQIQVFLHRLKKKDLELAKSLSQEADKNAERRGYAPLQMKLKKGDKVDVELIVYGATCLQTERKSMTWQGRLTNCSFRYFVPNDINVEDLSCEVNFYLKGALIGEMSFITRIVETPQVLNAEVIAKQFKQVFISYSHKDREKVEIIAKAYKAAGVNYFFDRHHLQVGDLWNEKILESIDISDLFILCWSQNAAESDYIPKEIERAVSHETTLKIKPYLLRPVDKMPILLEKIQFEDLY